MCIGRFQVTPTCRRRIGRSTKQITTVAAANGWQVNEHAHRHSIMEREIQIYEEINEEISDHRSALA